MLGDVSDAERQRLRRLDVLEALHSNPTARRAVAAVVTIAGSVIGSRLPAGIPRDLFVRWRDQRLGPCEIRDGVGVDSLCRAERAEAMSRLQLGSIKAYSIAATSTLDTTHPALRRGRRTLSAYSLEQDSQVIHEDAIVPGGTYLGMALGDHWAVALPFHQITPATPEAQQGPVCVPRLSTSGPGRIGVAIRSRRPRTRRVSTRWRAFDPPLNRVSVESSGPLPRRLPHIIGWRGLQRSGQRGEEPPSFAV